MRSNYYRILYSISFVLLGFNLAGQIEIDQYQSKFGKGETTLKKKINISFEYSEKDKTYIAKVAHRYDKLYIGGSYANGIVRVPFNSFQEVDLERARYFKINKEGEKVLLENVKVKFADVKDYFIQNIFYADLKVKQFNCSVELPSDYLISYSYEVKYNDLKFLTSFFFQDNDEAVEEVEIKIKKDEHVDFSIFEFNLDEIKKEEDGSYVKYSGKNLKRVKATNASVKGNYYLPHIIVSVGEFKSQGKTTEVLKSTDSMYKWYNSLINELRPDEAGIDKMASAITKNASSDKDKINDIFTWVQNNVQYVAFEDGIAGFKPTEAHKVASLKYGDCKGMANLLVNLLKAEGLDARHAWIGTRSNDYNYSIPSLVVDNHMICGLKFDNKMYYLDATSKSASWTSPPSHIEGKEVMVANQDAYEIYTIQKSAPKQNELLLTGSIDLNTKRKAIKLKVELTGHFKKDFISYETNAPLSDKENVPFYFVRKYMQGINVEQITKPVISGDKITYTISGTYKNVAVGSKTVVFPFLNVFRFQEIDKINPPAYINYPQTIVVDLDVKNSGQSIKENYPKSKIGNDNYNASYYTESSGGTCKVHQEIFLDILHTPVDDSSDWNDFVAQLNAFNNHPLIYE